MQCYRGLHHFKLNNLGTVKEQDRIITKKYCKPVAGVSSAKDVIFHSHPFNLYA